MRGYINIQTQLANLYRECSKQFSTATQKAVEPGLKQWLSQMAQMYWNQSQREANLALKESVQMMQGKAGGGSPGAAVASANKFIRVAEEESRMADEEMEDYWNDLLPGYGTALEHPQKHHDETTDDVDKSTKVVKKLHRVNKNV